MQGELLEFPSAQPVALEVHEHCFIRGPRSGGPTYKFSHSHAGGDVPHQHLDTGPSSYTIDKDEWFKTTGLKGGSRKKFTVKATGEQLPIVDLEDWQKSFEVHVLPMPDTWDPQFQGPGLALPARMVLTFGMKVESVTGHPKAMAQPSQKE